MLFHREAEPDENWETLVLEGVLGVTTRPVTLPVPLPTLPVTLPMLREGSTPEPAGAVATVDAELVTMGTVVVPDEPGLGPKVVRVGRGTGGRVRSLSIMLLTSLSTLLK